MAQGAPRSTFSSATSASRSDQLGRKYQPFSNPFFDLASTYTPPTVKSLFGFMRHFHLSHGIVSALNNKAAQYPITDLLLSHQHAGVLQRWEELMHGVLNYRVHQLEINLDYFVFGNAFVSPSLPFTKKLTCANCRKDTDAMRCRGHWRYSGKGFWLACQYCGQSDYAKATDRYEARLNDVSLIRWNPELIQIHNNEATGHVDYSLDFSADFKNRITMGDKSLVATTPQEILEAVRSNKLLVFDRKSVYHLRRPGLSGMQRWGVPLMMPVMKDVFYMQIMKKAQESVLLQHLIPQVFLFPQPATSGADPFAVSNLADWRDHIRRELARQRADPAYYGILPFPLGHQTIGENGKSLLLMPEIQAMAEHIVVGMGFPVDLVFGNGTYAGSSVNMRGLENFFLDNMQTHKRLVHWVMRHFATFFGWPMPDARFKAFRMADDLQRAQLLFQMNERDVVSETTALSQLDIKAEDEQKLLSKELEQKATYLRQKSSLMADVQGNQQMIVGKYTARAQAAAQAAAQMEAQSRHSPFDNAMGSDVNRQPGYSLDAAASALAKEIERMPPDRAERLLSQLRTHVPEMAQLVAEQQMAGMPQPPMQNDPIAAQTGGGPAQPAQAGVVNMAPLPEQLPPRRPGGV
jgi:hypothetical protein